ncbi:MAG TPA: SIS domain-containing protein [Acidobacteriota bacterium]|nr:SIS domain-containing protein [Acidobacteriota bacterium]
MHPNARIVEGNYWKDILDQPRALADTLEGLEESSTLRGFARRLNTGKFRQVVLTGMGSSFHGLHPLYLDLVDQGVPALMAETSELLHYQQRLFDPRHLIIAVSQSGRSAEVVSMLKLNRGRSVVIAVTNTPDSPLALQADVVVMTRAGEEFSVSCKTYVTALMALKWLGDALCEKKLRRTRRELEGASPLAATYLSKWKKHVVCLVERLRNTKQLYLLGRGASLAAAGTGGLIIKESDHFPAEGMSSAAFRHGPLEIVTGQTFVLLFSGSAETRELNRRLVQDVRKRQGQAELAGDDARLPAFRLPAAPDSIRPILEILPVEMITLAFPALAGREAGRFESATKVTTTE